MKEKNATKWKNIILLTAFFVVLFVGIREVSASSAKMCNVVFADQSGKVSNNTYKRWGRTVEAGTTITLPEYSKPGYRYAWRLQVGDKVQDHEYAPGEKFKITKDTKFCFKVYKMCNVVFADQSGKVSNNTYKRWGRTVEAGTIITLPEYSKPGYRYGWRLQVGNKIQNHEYAPGEKFKITKDTKFCFKVHNLSAASAKDCDVVFADQSGKVSNNTYKRWGRTVEAGTIITLPEYSKPGYRYAWRLQVGNKIQDHEYAPGETFKITKDTKFCFKVHKLYKIRFFSDGGSSEFKQINMEAAKGDIIKLPSVPRSMTKKGYGWVTSGKDKTHIKIGAEVKVTGDMKFYSRTKASTSVELYTYEGKFWKSIPTDTGVTPKFPAVDFGERNLNMCLGWSRQPGKSSHPEYYTGHSIPTKTGKYYMVKFSPADDKAPTQIYKSGKYNRVYFVGDSRFVQMSSALGSKRPSNVTFFSKPGKGLNWFINEGGYEKLENDIKRQRKGNPSSKIAVVVNLGVNDMYNCNNYIRYMREVANELKKRYGCTMYYVSVNPVNSAMIKGRGLIARTEEQVASFNRNIYNKLCVGNNACFKYIDTCNVFRRWGWISNPMNQGLSDGLHYSYATSLRIYNHIISKL